MKTSNEKVFPFGKQNYVLMLVGIMFIITGFVLMSGGASEDPDTFNPEVLFSTRRITVAPLVVFTGYIIEIFAIMHRPVNRDGNV